MSVPLQTNEKGMGAVNTRLNLRSYLYHFFHSFESERKKKKKNTVDIE